MKVSGYTLICTMSEGGRRTYSQNQSDTFKPSLGLPLQRIARYILNGVHRPYDLLWLSRAKKDALGDKTLAFELFRRKVPGRPEAVIWAHKVLASQDVPLVPTDNMEGADESFKGLTSHPCFQAPSSLSMGPVPSESVCSPQGFVVVSSGSLAHSKKGGTFGPGPTSLYPQNSPPGWDATQARGVLRTAAKLKSSIRADQLAAGVGASSLRGQQQDPRPPPNREVTPGTAAVPPTGNGPKHDLLPRLGTSHLGVSHQQSCVGSREQRASSPPGSSHHLMSGEGGGEPHLAGDAPETAAAFTSPKGQDIRREGPGCQQRETHPSPTQGMAPATALEEVQEPGRFRPPPVDRVGDPPAQLDTLSPVTPGVGD